MRGLSGWAVVAAALAAGAAAELCRADLVVVTSRAGYCFPRLQRYSNGGADLGPFCPRSDSQTIGETIDSIASAANGDVYPVGNTMGAAGLYHYNAVGQRLPGSPSSGPVIAALPWEGAAVGGGYVFLGSTSWGFQQSQTGVLEFDANTLAFVRNALPLPTPSGTDIALRDLALGHDGRLYVADPQRVARYAVSANGLLALDSTFAITATGNIEEYGGHVFVSDGQKIDQYDLNGSFQGVFVAAGTGGMQSINGYVFGDDGKLYLTSTATGGSQLIRFDGTTGAFEQQLRYEPFLSSESPWLGQLVFTTPEPGNCALLVAAFSLLCRRQRGTACWRP